MLRGPRTCAVALRRTIAASDSSMKKVDSPVMMSSRAPIRVKMRSTGESTHLAACNPIGHGRRP